MKTSKFSFLTFCLLWIFASACTREDNKEVKPTDKKASELPEPLDMYHRALTVKDTDGQEATLKFSSTNKELLDKMPLHDFTFKVVPTPAHALNMAEEEDFGPSLLEQMDLSPKLALKEEAASRQKANPVIWIDLISNTKKKALSIEVESKALVNRQAARSQTLYPDGTQVFFRGSTSWHRIQIDNLTYNALQVAFYYNSCDGNICQTNGDLKGTFTRYSGYNFTLYYNGWAWYRNCNRAVGALITISPNTYYHFRWTAWYGC
jgi:hypothetical protein